MLFKCTIFNGQQAIIPDYTGNDFAPNDNIHFINLSVGDAENYKGITELTVRCNSVHNDGTNTYIIFNEVFTKYTYGFIDLLDQLISNFKTIAQGPGISINFNEELITISTNKIITQASIINGTTTLDLSLSDWHKLTLDNTLTTEIALSNVVSRQQFTIEVIQDLIGNCLLTWFPGIKWSGGIVPTLSTNPNKIDIFTFKEVATGSYLGFTPGKNF